MAKKIFDSDRGFSDEEIIKYAAQGCYSPCHTMVRHSMQCVIEQLVLPDEVESYSEEEMIYYIRSAIQQTLD